MANVSRALTALGQGLGDMANARMQATRDKLNRLHDENMIRLREKYAQNRQLESEEREETRYQRRLEQSTAAEETRYQERFAQRTALEESRAKRTGEAKAATAASTAEKDEFEAFRKEINSLAKNAGEYEGFEGEYAQEIKRLLDAYATGNPTTRSRMGSLAADALRLAKDGLVDYEAMETELRSYGRPDQSDERPAAGAIGIDDSRLDVPKTQAPGDILGLGDSAIDVSAKFRRDKKSADLFGHRFGEHHAAWM
jgi:hypothetical protein